MKFIVFHSNYEYVKFLHENSYTSYDAVNIYGNTILSKSRILQFLFRIHCSTRLNKYISLPCKRIWFSYMLPKGLKKDEDICFIFNSSRVASIEKEFYSFLRKNYQCKLVMVLSNPVDWDISKGAYDFEEIRNTMDLVCTYNKIDVEKYHLTPIPYVLFQLHNIKVKPMKDRSVDVLFVGQDKGRMGYIEDLYNYLTSHGLKCEFYVVSPQNDCHTVGIHCSEWISYKSLIQMTENSKCILNILQPGVEGVTIRDTEAYNYGSFLITNNPSLEIKEVFNKEQLIEIIDINEDIIDVIKKRSEAFPKRDTLNTLDNYYNWIEKKLKN